MKIPLTHNGESISLGYESSGVVQKVDILILSISKLLPVVKFLYQFLKETQRSVKGLIELKNELDNTFRNPEGIFCIPNVNVKMYNELVNKIQEYCEIGYIIKEYIPVSVEEASALYTRRQQMIIEAQAKPVYEFDDSLNNQFKF